MVKGTTKRNSSNRHSALAFVSIDSGQFVSAKNKTGGDLDRVIGKWQTEASFQFQQGAEWLLQVIDEVDRLELWKIYRNGRFPTRDEFLEKKILINFDFTDQALPKLVERLRHGKEITLKSKTGPDVRLQRDNGIRAKRGKGMKLQAIANEVGLAKSTVHDICSEKPSSTKKPNKPKRDPHNRQLYIPQSPQAAAHKIIEKFGAEFAYKLMEALNE